MEQISPIIIDDLLPEMSFQKLANSLLNANILQATAMSVDENERDGSIMDHGRDNWERPETTPETIYNSTFQSCLYLKRWGSRTIMDAYHELQEQFFEIHEALNIKELVIARLVCTTGAMKNYKSQFHTDDFMNNKYELAKQKTCCYYLNSNNGGTAFSTGDFVQSQANRAVVFPQTLQHAGVWCTNKKLRFVLNFNYYEN